MPLDVAAILSRCRSALQESDYETVDNAAQAAYHAFVDLLVDEQHDVLQPMSDLYTLHAESMWRSGRRQGAIYCIGSMYALDVRSAELATKAGMFLRKAKQPEMAIAYYRRSLELDPSNVRTKMALKALQTDLRLKQNSSMTGRPPTEDVTSYSAPELPAMPSDVAPCPSSTWNFDDVPEGSLSSVASFSMPQSRAEFRTPSLSSVRSPPMPPSGSFCVQPLQLSIVRQAATAAAAAGSSELPPACLSEGDDDDDRTATQPTTSRDAGSRATVSETPSPAACKGASTAQLGVPPMQAHRSPQPPDATSPYSRVVDGSPSPQRPPLSSTTTAISSRRSESIGTQTMDFPLPLEAPRQQPVEAQRGPLQTSFSNTASKEDVQRGRAIHVRRLLAALIVVALLHNLLEGSQRPVFRVFGIPLSAISMLLVWWAAVRW